MADMMERNALTNATAQASQAESFAEQARRVNPAVQPVGRVQIAQGLAARDCYIGIQGIFMPGLQIPYVGRVFR